MSLSIVGRMSLIAVLTSLRKLLTKLGSMGRFWTNVSVGLNFELANTTLTLVVSSCPSAGKHC